MRKMNIIGLVHFLQLYQKYNSILSLAIFLHGLLYHSFKTNIHLRFYDYIFNFITCSYIFYSHFQEFKYYVFVSLSTYVLNLCVYDCYDYITRYMSDFIHVIGVQYVLSLALEKYIKIEKKKEKTNES